MAECNQVESSTRLVVISSLVLSFFFLVCAIVALGIMCIIGVKLRNMKRSAIEVLQKLQVELITSENTPISNSKAESGASLKHHSYSNVYVNKEASNVHEQVTILADVEATSWPNQPKLHSQIDAIPTLDDAVSTDVLPRQNSISEADILMPTSCTQAVNKAEAGAAFEMERNVAYKQYVQK